MIETGNSMDPSASLPYGMLFTKIFKANGVSLEGCEFEVVGSTYNAYTIKLMKYHLVNEKWVKPTKLLKKTSASKALASISPSSAIPLASASALSITATVVPKILDALKDI